MANSKFPNQSTTFKDTLGAGGITVRGFYLETDEDGFIEGPLEIADEIKSHGFLPMERPAPQSSGKGKK